MFCLFFKKYFSVFERSSHFPHFIRFSEKKSCATRLIFSLATHRSWSKIRWTSIQASSTVRE
ncbi:hypothetical protein MPC1_1120002 [Methylocella tundrae]|nr:hypothetical protein MPC1_1120002 [Methylocella tundrae]